MAVSLSENGSGSGGTSTCSIAGVGCRLRRLTGEVLVKTRLSPLPLCLWLQAMVV